MAIWTDSNTWIEEKGKFREFWTAIVCRVAAKLARPSQRATFSDGLIPRRATTDLGQDFSRQQLAHECRRLI